MEGRGGGEAQGVADPHKNLNSGKFWVTLVLRRRKLATGFWIRPLTDIGIANSGKHGKKKTKLFATAFLKVEDYFFVFKTR
jgi:hypothetical protein